MDWSEFCSGNTGLHAEVRAAWVFQGKGRIRKRGHTAESQGAPHCSEAPLPPHPPVLEWKLEFEIETLWFYLYILRLELRKGDVYLCGAP